jgi:CubicO group peptidase (beta-lactamase class C family)
MTERLIKEKLLTMKKEEYHYSNLGYAILGIIMEKVSNILYIECIDEYILSKLDLKETYVGEIKNILYSSKDYKTVKLVGNLYTGQYNNRACGAMVSSVHDLEKFVDGYFALFDEEYHNEVKKYNFLNIEMIQCIYIMEDSLVVAWQNYKLHLMIN